MYYPKNKNYQGFGIVELIIAIGIAAIAVTVLMTMAANSMKESVRLERQDALTRLAMDGALIIRKQVEDANNPEVAVGFGGPENFCYMIDNDEENPLVNFDESKEEVGLEEVDAGEPFSIDIIYDWIDEDTIISDVYYWAYCVDDVVSSADGESETYVGRVVTGFVDCGNCNILPYEHGIVVNVINF